MNDSFVMTSDGVPFSFHASMMWWIRKRIPDSGWLLQIESMVRAVCNTHLGQPLKKVELYDSEHADEVIVELYMHDHHRKERWWFREERNGFVFTPLDGPLSLFEEPPRRC